MHEPIKVNVVSYGGVKPGTVVLCNDDGGKEVILDTATATSINYICQYRRIKHVDLTCPNATSAQFAFNYAVDTQTARLILPKVTSATDMFSHGSTLTELHVEMPKYTGNSNAFIEQSKLKKLTGDLSGVVSDTYLFLDCPIEELDAKLTSLSNLGASAMNACRLNEASAIRLLTQIPSYTSGTHNLPIGHSTNFKNSSAVAELLGTVAPIAAGSYSMRGWTVTVKD